MAHIVAGPVRLYRYLNDERSDPRTKDWFLMSTPWPIVGLLVFYLYFVHKLGPRLMANRPPVKLDKIVQIYNASQIVISSYLFFKALQLGWLSGYSYRCEPVDYSDSPHALAVARMVWVYLMVKIYDLLDTVFFVLRKKQSQVTFLHVYHHTGMAFAVWCGVKWFAGGHITFLGYINSFVHIIMYGHYLATSLKIGRTWWKKYITQLQMVQFFLIMLHFAQLLWVEPCGFPVWMAYVFIPQNLLMLVLFGNFYYKAYVARNPRKRAGSDDEDVCNNNAKKKD